MEDSHHYFFQLGFLILLLCLSAFFSAGEMAFSALNRIKLKSLAEKSKRARLALRILDVYDKLLSTVLIGNNVVSVAATALATAFFIGLFGAKGISISTLVMTVIFLIFCDISQKALAKETPELTALRTAPLLRFFIFIFTPFNYMTAAWKKFIMKIFPVKEDRSATEDELLTFVEEVRQEGGINKHEEQMIRQVIEFDDIKASEIFTPRMDVAAVSHDSTVEEIDKKFIETGFSRLPVFQDTLDNITGIIIFKDFYHEVVKGLKTPAHIVKPVVYVHKTIKIAKLLKTMQSKKSHLAVVVDEYGGTLGIVTIEDIVEELVGEIWDEHEEIIEPVKKGSGGIFTVLGGVSFADMLEKITEGEKTAFDDLPDTTVANWIMESLGRLPRTGEKLTWHFLTIQVSRVVKQRVLEVNVKVDEKTEGQ